MEGPPIHVPIQDPELLAALGSYAQNMGQIGLTETIALANIFARRNPSLMAMQMAGNAPAGGKAGMRGRFPNTGSSGGAMKRKYNQQ